MRIEIQDREQIVSMIHQIERDYPGDSSGHSNRRPIKSIAEHIRKLFSAAPTRNLRDRPELGAELSMTDGTTSIGQEYAVYRTYAMSGEGFGKTAHWTDPHGVFHKEYQRVVGYAAELIRMAPEYLQFEIGRVETVLQEAQVEFMVDNSKNDIDNNNNA